MIRKTTLLIGALALMLAATQAQAATGDWTLGLNGGTSIPLSDFKDVAKVGFLGGVSIGYSVTDNVTVGADGSFLSNSGSDLLNDGLTAVATLIEGTPTTVTGKTTMIQGGAHLKYMFPMAAESAVSPYVVLGAGVYNVKLKTESANPTYAGDTSESKFGGRGGLGINYMASEKVGIGLEGAFHVINTDVVSTKLISLQAGVNIGLSTPK